MKVIAMVTKGYTPEYGSYLVEMTGNEFLRTTGSREVFIGAEGDPVALLRMLQNVRDGMKSAERSAGGFRALADLIDQCVGHAKVAINGDATPAAEPQEVQS